MSNRDWWLKLLWVLWVCSVFIVQTIPGYICRDYGQSCDKMDLKLKQTKKNSWWFTKTVITRKKNRNTKLTFLYNYSSDHTEKTEAKSHSEGAVKLLAAIWIHLYRTIINSAFYKSGPHSRRAKRKALMEDMSGAKYSVVWLNLYWTFQQCYKALCLTKPTQSQL